MTTTWQLYPLMHVNNKHIHNQPYINPNKSYKPEFVRLKDQPGGQCMWQVSPTTSPWPVSDCALSATLSNWVVHVAAHSIKLRSAYSWISLISAVCNSQAPFDLYFQRLRDLDLSTSSVLSVYMMSIWSLPASGRSTRCESWIFSSTLPPKQWIFTTCGASLQEDRWSYAKMWGQLPSSFLPDSDTNWRMS